MSIGPLSLRICEILGWATSRKKISLSIAAGDSRPNHGTSPGPWLTGANPTVPDSAFSAIHTGVVGPMAEAIGTTVA